MKYLATVVSLVWLAKTLIWNKIAFQASNLLNLAELAYEEYLQKCLPIFLFYSICHCLMYRFQELITKELDNFTKILISKVFDLS